MKNKIFKLFFILSLCAYLLSCVKEDELGGGAAPPPNTLTSDASTGSTVVLLQSNANAKFSALSWTATNFGTKTVKYSIEMDKAGNNFAHAKDVLTTGDLTTTFTVDAINTALINYGIKPGESADMEIRVRSWVDYLTTPGLSNSVEFTLTPYLITFPPLYIIGDAQAWTLTNAVPLTSHTPGVYTGKAKFMKNGKFRLFALPDWTSTQYGWGYFVGGTIPGDFANGQDSDSNFLFGGLSADYNITVSLPDKKVTLELAGPPPPPESIFFVTAQTIDLSTAIEFPSIASGVYEKVIAVPKNTKFRFFTELNWTKDKWGWSYFDATAIDSDLGDSGDDVSDFVFLSSASDYYKITVSIQNKSIVVVPSAPPFPATLLVNGDPYSWDFTKAAVLLSTGVGVYEGMIKVTTAGGFRFFSTNDWVQPQWGFDKFTTVPSQFTDGGGSDHNLTYAGATRYYKITVSLVNKTIAISNPVLNVIGDDQAWTLGNAFALTWQSAGTFVGTTTFSNNSTFRFFIAPNWSQPKNEFNFTSFTTVDTDLTNAGGSDQNFKFNGTTGSHTITVNLINATVDIN